MSEFDEEAEREKLRKQFERDKQKREDTERMSELLLQGATMTDTHCDTCGDPLFRYEGQEFCPSCQVQTDDQQQTDAEQPPETTETSESTQIEIEDETTVPDEPTAPDKATASDKATAPDKPTVSDEPTASDKSMASDKPTEPVPNTTSTTTPDSPSTTNRSDGDLSAARQSLATTITRFAKHAESTEDPDRARDFLAATEDAATALEAINQATK